MKTVLMIAAAVLGCTGGATAASASTVLYQGAGTNLDGTITPEITTEPARSISYLVTFNPSATADPTSALQGGVLINEFGGGYPASPAYYASELEVENDGTVLASVYDYVHILNLGKVNFGQQNVASFAYDASTGTFSGMLNGVSVAVFTAGQDVRTTPSDYIGYTDTYYGIGTAEPGAYLGGYTLSDYDPANSSEAQAFDGTITGVTIDDSGSLLQPIAAAVPEPASWALMIGGFGLVGGTLRRRRTAARLALA